MKGREDGFTIPELLIGAMLAGAAATLIATAIYQIAVASRQGNDRLAVLNDIQSTSLWLGRDASEAQSFSAGSGSTYGTLATWDPTVEYRYSYDSANTSLVREVVVSGSVESTQRIARHIANQADVTFTLSGSLLTVSLTATSGAETQSGALTVSMRVQ